MQNARVSQTRGIGVFSFRRLRWLFLFFLYAMVCIAPRGQQQNAPNPFSQQRQQNPYGGLFDDDSTVAHRQLNALNVERQKTLVSDTEKLLKLAQELNAEIATSNSETLNSGQMRKIASIEKLAHDVKQKMSESLGGGPSLHDPILPTARQP